jgi:hypothetical protein
MSSAKLSLAELQHQLQRVILHPASITAAAFDNLVVAGDCSAPARIGIYATAYELRLIDALTANFPRLQSLLGADAFTSLARRFIADHPSRNVSVRWFGYQLPAYLRRADASHEQPWIAELAAWEWAVADSFDAQDATSLTVAVLAEVAPSQWPQLRFELHPSVRRLQLTTNAVAMFKAGNTDLAAVTPSIHASPEDWLIWRQELSTRFRSSSRDEAAALAVVADTGTFAELCDVLCDSFDADEVPARAASLLKTWVNDGLIVGYTTN